MGFWARENHDRPILYITAPKDKRSQPPVSKHKTEKERWMDTEFVLKRENWRMQNTVYLGEAFSALNPDFGPDFFCILLWNRIRIWRDNELGKAVDYR